MRSRSRLHGILGLAIHGDFYKWKEYRAGVRPKPLTLCRVKEATHTAAGRKRREDQIAEYLQRLIDSRKVELSNPTIMVSTLSGQWLEYVSNTKDIRTMTEYSTAMRYYLDSIPDHPISELNIDHWGRYQKSMEGLAPATIAKHQQAFRTFLKYAANHVDFKFDIQSAKKISVPSKTIRDYSPEELAQIEDHIRSKSNQDHLRIHMMLSETGIRAGELLNLKLHHIDLDARKIWIVTEDDWSPKTGVDNWVPISEKLAQFLIDDEREYRGEGEVWFLDDGHGGRVYWHVGAIGRVLMRICKRLGITGRKPLHAYRASMAKRIYKKFGLVEAQKILRHSNPMMTRKYIDDSDFNLHDVVNAVSI